MEDKKKWKMKQSTACTRGIAEKVKRPISSQSSEEGLSWDFEERQNITRKKRRKQLRPVRMMVLDELPEEEEMENYCLNVKHDYQSSMIENGINLREKEANISVPLDLSVNHFSNDKDTSPIHEMVSDGSDISAMEQMEHKVNIEMPLNTNLRESIGDREELNSDTCNAELIMRQILRNALASGGGNKIFNLDAFCNICNKEFCNKYFLKTHKANKHGIYYENHPENVNTSILSSITNMFNKQTKQVTSKLQRSNSQSTTSSGGNKDSSVFCNFCEKDFCNKYFLKKHKEKMHGVIQEKDSKKKDKVYNDYSNTSGDDSCDKDTRKIKVPIISKSRVESENKVPIIKTEQTPQTGIVVPLGESSTAPGQSKKYTRHTVSEMLKLCIKNVDKLPENKPNAPVTTINVAAGNFGSEQNTIPPMSMKNILQQQLRFPDVNTVNQINAINNNTILQDSHNLGNASEELILQEIVNRHGNLFDISQYDEQKFNSAPNGLEGNLQEFVLNNSTLVNGNYTHVTPNNPSVYNGENDKVKLKKPSPATMEQTVDSIMVSVHRDTKQNNCIVCNKYFSGYLFARLHEKYVHMITFRDMNHECSSTTDYSGSRYNFLMPKDELQRLQHLEKVYFMIIKFSGLNTFVTFCEICKRDYEKSDLLEMHLINNHSEILDEISGIIDDVNSSVLNLKDGLIICNNCNMVFATVTTLQHHMYENCSSYIGTTTVKEEGKAPNFCNICKKELCNKYFMRTHMQRMHGICMENNTRIGGVTCEICNKELCSKYFLRVHKRNCHGILDGIEITKSYPPFILGHSISIKDVENTLFEDTTLKFLPQTCLICRKIFKNVKWLKTHLVNEHKEIGLNVWNEILSTYVMQGGLNNTEKFSNVNNGYMSNGDSNRSSGSLQRNVSTNTEPMMSPTVVANRKEPQPKGRKSHQCKQCSFFTAIPEALIAHEELHKKHNISTQENVDFCCLYCLHVAKDRISLENHTKAYHFTNDGVENSIRLDQYEGLAAKTVAAVLSGEIAISTLSPKDTQVGDPVNIESASGYNYVTPMPMPMPLPSYQYKSDQFVKVSQTCIDNTASGLINMRKKSNVYNIRK